MQIRLNEVEFRYGEGGFRLVIPEWELEAGQSAVFIGPSGSGKSTLLQLLAGILAPQKGTIKINSHNLPTLPDAERRTFRIRNVGFVFQDFRLVEYLNVRENMLLPYRINDALTLDESMKLESLAEALGIVDYLDKFTGELSQGEKQRVAIGRALLPKPGLVLADEPTGNLDPDNTKRIINLLFAHAADATLVMVTHDHSLTKHFSQVIDFRQFYQ